MVILKKKSAELNGERTGKGILSFPRFYIKSVSANLSIYHRLTHSYMGSFASERELIAELERLNSIPDKELWERLLVSRGFSVTSLESKAVRDKVFESEEDWYYGAWGIYTTKFYEGNPHLFREEVTFPRDIVNAVRHQLADERKKQHARHVASIEKAESYYKTGRPGERPTEPAKALQTPVKNIVPSIIKEEEEAPPVKKIKRIKLPKPVDPFA